MVKIFWFFLQKFIVVILSKKHTNLLKKNEYLMVKTLPHMGTYY